jgi:hypothetical protein
MKERLENFMSLNADKTIIKPEDLDLIRNMRESVFKHPEAKELLSDGEAELSGYWNDPAHDNILCKMRMDFINKPKRVIVDLKKTRDARPHRFKNDAYSFGYHLECSFYCYGATQITGVEHTDFYFIAVEDKEPYGVMVYKADMEMIDYGLKECSKALSIYRECLEADHWPCYPEDVQDLSLPGWLRRKENNFAIFD